MPIAVTCTLLAVEGCVYIGCLQVCFGIQELDLVLQSSKRTLPDFLRDLVVTVIIGKAIPILLAALLEAHSRADFLRSRCAVNTHRAVVTCRPHLV